MADSIRFGYPVKYASKSERVHGVYVPAPDGGAPVFAAAPPLADEDVQEIVETAAQRIVRLLQRRGLLDDSLVDELSDYSAKASNPQLQIIA